MSEPIATTPEAAAPGLPQPERATQAVASVLRPLARLMIDHGLQLSEMVELLKQALVSEAQAAYATGDKASTDTRVALLTGVHRKDVKRLRLAPESSAAEAPAPSVAASVVARWISQPHYLNTDQSPRRLARTPRHSAPGEPDFSALVAEVSRDLGARAVLDELLRLGVVRLTDDDTHLELVQAAFVPRPGVDAAMAFLAANASDHLSAAVHNLSPQRQGAALLEQSAFCADLSERQAGELHQRARQLWAAMLQGFLQTATVAEQRSAAEPGPRHRVRLGVYFNDALQSNSAPAGDAP